MQGPPRKHDFISASKYRRNKKTFAFQQRFLPPWPVGETGFEPATPCSQSRCANRTALHPVRSYENRPPKGSLSFLSGRLDSNQRPPTPEAGALTGLRYTPNKTPILVRAHKDTPKNRNNQIIRKKTTSPLENMPTERYSTAKKLMLKRFNNPTASLPRRFTNAA